MQPSNACCNPRVTNSPNNDYPEIYWPNYFYYGIVGHPRSIRMAIVMKSAGNKGIWYNRTILPFIFMTNNQTANGKIIKFMSGF